MKNKPRKPWIAGVFTLITIGLGHLYYGKFKRGVSLFFFGLFVSILAFSILLLNIRAGLIIFIIILIAYKVYCIVDSFRGARSYKDHYIMRKYNRWYIYLLYWFATIVVTQTFAINVRSNIIQAFKIPSGAMKETIQIGDHILANKLIYKNSEPERGDIIIFPFPENPSLDYIKRVIGLNGETIEIRDMEVIINGKVLDEPYAFYHDEVEREPYGPIKIPEDSLFVMGDNRDNSYDSRYWGFVKTSEVKGKAINIYWSWDSEASKIRWNRTGKELK